MGTDTPSFLTSGPWNPDRRPMLYGAVERNWSAGRLVLRLDRVIGVSVGSIFRLFGDWNF
jgi:hypothetical protein